MSEFVEDGGCFPPGRGRGFGIAGRVVAVAEVGQGGGLVVALADLAVQREGLPVAGDGLVVLAEAVVRRAERIQGRPQPDPVTGFLQQGPRLSAVRDRLLVLAEKAVAPADVVEGAGLSDRV